MKELFSKHAQFEDARPLMKHSTYWYQERAGHEVEEWKMEDPTLDPEAFLSEASDVFLFWAAALNSAGISPEVAHQAILQKIELNEQRFPTDLFQEGVFSEAYKEAKRREGKDVREFDVYTPSVFAPENDHFEA